MHSSKRPFEHCALQYLTVLCKTFKWPLFSILVTVLVRLVCGRVGENFHASTECLVIGLQLSLEQNSSYDCITFSYNVSSLPKHCI